MKDKTKIITLIIILAIFLLFGCLADKYLLDQEEEWQEGNWTCKRAVMCINNDCQSNEGDKICVMNKSGEEF